MIRKIRAYLNAADWRMIALLTFLSFALRVVFWLPVAYYDVGLVGDEWLYYARSTGIANIVNDTLRGRPIESADLDLLYQGHDPLHAGWWPPLQPALIAIGRMIPGQRPHEVAKARLLTVIVSAVTTSLVYLTTAKVFTKRAAIVASAIHVLYPSFIAFSHFLWSETLYIFLLFAAVHCAISIPGNPLRRRGFQLACCTGLFLGLGALARAASLPYLVVFPLWLVFALRAKGRGTFAKVLPVVVVVSSIIVLLPWELMLFSREGRVVPLATSNSFNFFRATSGLSYDRAQTTLTEYTQRHSVTRDAAASTLAEEHLQENPLRYVKGVWRSFFQSWAGDGIALRHVFSVYYPPTHQSVALVILFLFHSSFIFLVAATCWGVWGGPSWTDLGVISNQRLGLLTGFSTMRGLLSTSTIVAVLLAFPTLGNSRYALPALALFLPFAGHGIASCRLKDTRRPFGALCAVLLVASSLVANIRFSYRLGPSSHYLDVAGRLSSYVGAGLFADRIVLRTQYDGLQSWTIEVVGDVYRFEGNGERSYTWQTTSKGHELALTLTGYAPDARPQVLVTNDDTQDRTIIDPIQIEAWHEWQPSGIDGVEYKWISGR